MSVLRKSFALRQQRLPGHAGCGRGDAVAEVQRSRMTRLAELPPGIDGGFPVACSKLDDHRIGDIDQLGQEWGGVGTHPRRQHDPRLDQRRNGDCDHLRAIDLVDERRACEPQDMHAEAAGGGDAVRVNREQR